MPLVKTEEMMTLKHERRRDTAGETSQDKTEQRFNTAWQSESGVWKYVYHTLNCKMVTSKSNDQ